MSPSKVSTIKFDEFSNIVDGKPRGSKEKHQGTSRTNLSISDLNESLSSNCCPGTNPATGEKLWEVPIANQQDVDDAVVAAQRAFEKWSMTTLEERREKIRKFKEHYLSYADEMIELEKKETGKPVRLPYHTRGSTR